MLLQLVLLRELVDLFLFGVEDLELLFSTHAASVCLTSWLVTKLVVDLLDVAGVVIDHLAHFTKFFVLLLNLSVVLLDSIHESLSSLREG